MKKPRSKERGFFNDIRYNKKIFLATFVNLAFKSGVNRFLLIMYFYQFDTIFGKDFAPALRPFDLSVGASAYFLLAFFLFFAHSGQRKRIAISRMLALKLWLFSHNQDFLA